MFLMCRITESKRRHGQEQTELNKQRITEKELTNLNLKINKLLNKLEEHDQEVATSIEEECVICIQSKASVTTYPCNHCVICRRCFVKTIQNAVSQKNLPLRCVICRAKILRLKQSFNSELLLETTRSGKYKRGRYYNSHPYGYQQAKAKPGNYPKNAKKCSPPEIGSSSSKSACKKRISQQAAINQGGKDHRGSIESRKVDLEKLKVAERNEPTANTSKSANPVAYGRHSSETGESVRCATPGAPNDSLEPAKCGQNGETIEEVSNSSRSLSPDLESSRKRIEKLNKLTSERSLNHRTLKARIFNYFSFARATPRCTRDEQDGELAPNGELDNKREPNCCPPKKKTSWSARFQKFKCKTSACIHEVRILLDL